MNADGKGSVPAEAIEMPASNAPPPALQWKKVISWALYDWANSAYATTVMAGFFPIFLKDYWCPGDMPVTESSFRLSMANSITGVVVAALAPVLGAIADRGGAKKKFLLFFAMMGIVMTAGLYFVTKGHWGAALVLYALATMGFSGANVFYDSLLVGVAPEKKFDLVSALGYSLGYLGGGLLFGFNVWMVLHPATFGLAATSDAVRWAFLLTGIWWAVFTVPLLVFVKEPRDKAEAFGGWATVAAGFRQLRETFREVRKLRLVFLFLAAYWLYIDGVDTIVQMAVDYGKSLGFDSSSLITALLITQFVGFPAAIAFGKIGEKLGARAGIFIGLAVYLGVTVYGYFMDNVKEFYVLAVVIGLVQGGVQSLSRALYGRLIPGDKAAEFFGFYNMLGKFAAIIGPLLMGVAGKLTGNPRIGILAIIPLFIGGGLILSFVRQGAAKEK
jgi:UMF1 family MFS transporter